MALEHESDSALARAVREMKSQSAFARLIGRPQSTISLWLKNGTPLPAEYLERVSEATLIPVEELRPDLPWDKASLPSLPAISTTSEAAR
jgi:DNA-binding transcriptional regulator YdaS (Cro superfamily)